MSSFFLKDLIEAAADSAAATTVGLALPRNHILRISYASLTAFTGRLGTTPMSITGYFFGALHRYILYELELSQRGAEASAATVNSFESA